MKLRARRWLQRGAFGVALACVVALGFLRVGRPLYFSDGQTLHRADELAEATLVVWERPTASYELPGPVSGRIAELEDGRLVYGRVLEGGTTDLVGFDPKRPGLGADPLIGLNSGGHDLSPALAADGSLWFASDRGGDFDIYVAPRRGSGFGVPVQVPAPVQSPLDECDPAPDPLGGVAFVRRDPAVQDGRNGTLLHWRDGGEPRPLLGIAPAGTIDRDPHFAPDGVALWFVREVVAGAPQVLRTHRHGNEWAAPQTIDALNRVRALRSPLPNRDGFELRLVHPGDGATAAPLVYLARAHEVYPWWEGQAGLERLLVLVLFVACLILVLLVLGQRYHQLDFVTWCLLVSLLVHLLVLFFLGQVDIVRHYQRSGPGGGGLQVELISGAGGADAGNDMTAVGTELAGEIAFEGSEMEVAAGAPSSDLDASAASPQRELTPAANGDAGPRERHVTVAPLAASGPPAPAARTGRDAGTAALGHAPLAAAPQEQARVAAARTAEGATDVVRVVIPGSALADAGGSARGETVLATGSALELGTLAPSAAAAAGAPPAVAIDDAPTALPSRGRGAGETTPVAGGALHAGAVGAATPVPVVLETAGRGEAAAATGTGDATLAPQAGGLAASDRPAAGRSAASPDVAGLPLPVAGVRLGTPGVTLRDALPGTTAPSGSGSRDAALPALAVGTKSLGVAAGASTANALRPERESGGGEAVNGHETAPATAGMPNRSGGGARRAGGVAESALPGPRTSAAAPGLVLRDGPAVPGGGNARPGTGSGARSAAPAPLVAAAPGEIARAKPAALTGKHVAGDGSGGGGAEGPAGEIKLPGSLLEGAPRASVVVTSAPVVASSPFQLRFGADKAKAIEKFGGSKETELAVQNGLRYLAKIQRRDGSWGDHGRGHEKYGQVWVGKTALCLLAFLGAGHVPGGDGEHAAAATKAVEFLLAVQEAESGHFGASCAYSHGITTYALAECYGLTKNPRLREPVQRAVDWIQQMQNGSPDRRSRGGWGYYSGKLEPEDGFARTSVTAWQVMALESAKLAGFEVSATALANARAFVLGMFDEENGYFLYNKEPGRLRSSWRTLPASTPASVFALFLLGHPTDDERIRAALDFTADRAPTEYRRYSDDQFVRLGAGNVYFWYYGTLACFFAGGEAWDRWNRALKSVIPPAQSADGSFAPIDVYSRYAGDTDRDRAYTTAMIVLSLEVYYRYFTPLLMKR